MKKFTAKSSRKLSTKRLPEMDVSPPAAVPKTNQQIQDVAEQKQEDGIVHFSHPLHPLVQVDTPYLFMCMGCKEYGAGKRFRCLRCSDFDLHDFCATAPASIDNHPLHHKHHKLVFFTKSAGGLRRSRCDVCGKAAKGYTFRCASCSFEMHPSCAAMREEMNFPVHHHPLRLSSQGDSVLPCRMCRKKRSGQVYFCASCNYHIHAVCAKDLVNGLYVHGFKSPEKPSALSTAARVAAHAFLGIIGGLIEGIGEGIGDALVENVGRSRSIKKP